MNITEIQIQKWVEDIILENPILIIKLDQINTNDGIDGSDILLEVVKFLYLVSSKHIKLTPSKIVDLGWHEFILFTKAYQIFCSSNLGRFIHHTPDDNKVSNNRNFLKTIQCYITVFGKPNPDIWGDLANQEWLDLQCGSCETN